MIKTILSTTYEKHILKPILKLLQRQQRIPFAISPNQITVVSMIIGLCVPVLIIMHWYWLAVMFLLCSGLLDSLDGALARLYNDVSAFGTVLDIVADRIVEVAVVIGLFFYDPDQRAVVCVFMLASIVICVTSFLVVAIFMENNTGKSFYYSPGWIERPETFAFFIAMILLPRWFNVIGFAFFLLVFITAFVRVYQFRKVELKRLS